MKPTPSYHTLQAQLEQRGQALSSFAGATILDDCYAVIHLRVADEPRRAGDHDLVICSVEGYETRRPAVQPLSTGYLRDLGLM